MNSQLFLAISTIFLAPFLLFFFMKQKKRTIGTRKLPPGPKKLPLIGNLHQIGDLPHRSLQRLANEYGPLIFLQLGSMPTLVISSADMAREIFRTHDNVFSGRPVMYAANKISYNCNDITFAPYGKYWRELRKITILELLSAKRVQSFEAIRDNEVTLMIDSIAKCSNNPINLSELMLLLANDVICRVAFGQKVSDGIESGKSKFDEIIRETQNLLDGFSVVDFFPSLGWVNKFNGFEARVDKNFRELDNLYDRVIEEHLDPTRRKPEHEDLVDVLLRIQSDPNQAITLSNYQVKGVLTDMFNAGTDTSSATLVWIMTELIKNPSVMRKAREEVRGIANGKGKEKVEESDLSGLVYTKCVIKEALRLHPPLPLLVPRETIESCVIEGYEIPAKTRVIVNAKSIATDPKYWENPNEFRPERFLENSIDLRGLNFELVPFGLGRRGCPGINFSLLLVELALANLLFCFDWTLPEGVKAEDIDMDEGFGLTMHKKIPLFLVPIPANVFSA